MFVRSFRPSLSWDFNLHLLGSNFQDALSLLYHSKSYSHGLAYFVLFKHYFVFFNVYVFRFRYFSLCVGWVARGDGVFRLATGSEQGGVQGARCHLLRIAICELAELQVLSWLLARSLAWVSVFVFDVFSILSWNCIVLDMSSPEVFVKDVNLNSHVVWSKELRNSWRRRWAGSIGVHHSIWVFSI